MTTPHRNKIFRQAALERLSSPEKLDQPATLIRPMGRLLGLTVVVILIILVSWISLL